MGVQNSTGIRQGVAQSLRNNTIVIVATILTLLLIIFIIPGPGVLTSFVLIAALLWIRKDDGVGKEIGLFQPKNFSGTLILSVGIALLISISFTAFFDPLLARLTGVPMDLGPFEGTRGKIIPLLMSLAAGWAVGGFIEEITFRGYLISQLKRVFGDHPVTIMVLAVLTSCIFGFSHLYQGTSGIISTGIIGFILAGLYIKSGYNLWLSILTHGFVDSFSLIMIYLEWGIYVVEKLWST